MPFNPKQAYGVVTGHPWARYEQNGILYGADGSSLDDKEEEVEDQSPPAPIEEPTGHERDFALEHAREFLKTVLGGGPVTRSSVFREAQLNNQEWTKVEQAFHQIGGQSYKAGNWTYWKLKTE